MPLFKAELSEKEIQRVRVLKAELGLKNNEEFLIEVTKCCREARVLKGRQPI